LDFIHGIVIGQDQVAFHPIYRVRQSLAIAISRMRTPPTEGYLAYRSVIDALSQNGFAIFTDDPGVHLDVPGWARLLEDNRRVERALQAAAEVPVDPSRAPEILGANELGYSDFIYYSFRLFGIHISSLYYFYFLLLAISCGLFLLEYRRLPFFMFVLAVYLAQLFFLQNYASAKGVQLATLSNSRVFSAVSLLPAFHIFLAIWLPRPFSLLTLTTTFFQAILLAFILTCRSEVIWQVGLVLAAVPIALLLATRLSPVHERLRVSKVFLRSWPAALMLIIVFASTALVNFNVDARYKAEPKSHIFWHDILGGILAADPKLRREYTGEELPASATISDKYTDTVVYAAVLRDLNERRDARSPIARVVNGTITIDLMSGWGEYDHLVRSLAFRVIRDHPVGVFAGFFAKVRDQVEWYSDRNGLARANFTIPIALIVLSALSFSLTSGFRFGSDEIRGVVIPTALVLVFAAIPITIQPSAFLAGTLLCYLSAFTIAIASIVIGAVWGLLFESRSVPKRLTADADKGCHLP